MSTTLGLVPYDQLKKESQISVLSCNKRGLKGSLSLPGLSLIRVISYLDFEISYLEFEKEPPLIRISSYQDPTKQTIFEEGIQSLLQKEAFEEVLDTSSHGFYCGMFLVTKNIRDWRFIIYMSVLNTYLKFQIFRMESADSI